MSPNFAYTVTSQPVVDAGALIDRVIPGEPGQRAARAVMTKLLTDGETTQYEDGRTGVYLAADHRPAVQPLVDAMPAEDRQRLLDLFSGTALAPALEGLILGRWPARSYPVEVRECIRLPELRKYLPTTAGPDFVAKLSAAQATLRDRSPTSPARPLMELLEGVERDAPKTPSGGHVGHREFAALCRSDPHSLALAREWSKGIQDTSVAVLRVLRGPSSSYLPRTPGGTRGEGVELSPIDRADIADYSSFLCCLARELMSFGQGGEQTVAACTSVAKSVLEALLISFLHRRFPEMAAPADAEVEGSRPQSAEDHERIRRQIDRKTPLLFQTEGLLKSFHESAKAQPELFVRGRAFPIGRMVAQVLRGQGKSVRAWLELRLLSDSVNVPASLGPAAEAAPAFLHPLPDLSMLHCLEKPESGRNPRGRPRRGLHLAITDCKHDQSTILSHAHGTTYPDEGYKGVGASIGVHAADAGPCLSFRTFVPVSQFLHPEDPASIVAAVLARQAGKDVQDMLALLKDFGVENQVREAAGEVPRLDFFHCKRTVRGPLFFGWKRVEHFVSLVMRRRDAVRLGILDRVRAFPQRDRVLMRRHMGFCPEHPVALRMDLSDDGGGDGPPPPTPPPPEPERRNEPEDAPTRAGVGSG